MKIGRHHVTTIGGEKGVTGFLSGLVQSDYLVWESPQQAKEFINWTLEANGIYLVDFQYEDWISSIGNH